MSKEKTTYRNLTSFIRLNFWNFIYSPYKLCLLTLNRSFSIGSRFVIFGFLSTIVTYPLLESDSFETSSISLSSIQLLMSEELCEDVLELISLSREICLFNGKISVSSMADFYRIAMNSLRDYVDSSESLKNLLDNRIGDVEKIFFSSSLRLSVLTAPGLT